jgi:hypothetical protein
MLWRVTVRSPKSEVSVTLASEPCTADEFVEALYAFGLAGLQRVDGVVRSVKPLSISIQEVVDAKVNREVVGPDLPAVAAGD